MSALRTIKLTHRCGHGETHRVAASVAMVLQAWGERYTCSACVRRLETLDHERKRAARKRKQAAKRAATRRGCINQAAVRQVYRYLYGEPLPKGWRVEWAGFMRGALGLCICGEKRILLSYADFARKGACLPGSSTQVLATLAHEFVHVRNQGMRHGSDFRRLEQWAANKLGIDATSCQNDQTACPVRSTARDIPDICLARASVSGVYV